MNRTEQGSNPTIEARSNANRFRHTVGTQFAERGAKLHTIMKVLGHTSISMALVYAQVSDQEVLRDYKAVLGPGATIAGAGRRRTAQRLAAGHRGRLAHDELLQDRTRTRPLPPSPRRSPCECDLYLTCAKFVTTPEYAPRLRARREVEQTLALDAAQRGWEREVERHRCTSDRIDKPLADLGQPAHPEKEAENASP
ncbi:tyrosine-type recombinase/integrase [Streptomyces sp. NPDC006649]|uniref:tyrosine-type recombinase/integrase n=1 Tax=Streptomyces sp. NPDC006649 TaxID=3156896 RepID=UPI0033BF9ED7